MRKQLSLCLTLAALSWGCASELPVFEPVPEPASALRPAADRGVVPEDARITDYVLEAHLDAEQHRITGSARVTWRNRTERTVDSLPFHLYMNGFRAEDTEWLRSSHGKHRSSEVKTGEGTWGYIDVHSVELLGDASDTTTRFVEDAIEKPTGSEAVSLPFREHEEPSTMTVDLPHQVGPGESVTVALDFTTQLPSVVARTGYHEDFHAVGQWFPKLGVLEESGWQAHTFTVYDEFYANFGNYTVTLDVPEDTVVGATGIRTGEEISDGRKHLTYVAEMVHDFAWMADPNFVEHFGEHEGIRIRQLIQPKYVETADDHLEAVTAALDSYQARYGPYPWSTITIIHVPEDARGAGGMEYPTLFTTSDRDLVPQWLRRSVYDERTSGVFTTVHEFGHQYFQGLFASREHLEPWLDEGMTTLSNHLSYRDQYQSDDPWLVDLLSQRLTLSDVTRFGMRFRAFLEPLARPAREFDTLVGNYGSTVYMRTGALMMTLRNLVGEDDFDRALRVYCDRARFRHPTGEELVATLVEELGGRVEIRPGGAAPEAPAVELDVAEFLDQALNSTRRVEFSIVDVRNRRLLGDAGWHRDAHGELVGGEAPDDLETELEDLPDEAIEGGVVVHRSGGFIVPVELLVEFSDGSEERLLWDAREPTAVFRWSGRRVKSASLDPERLLLLEAARLDNHAYARDAEADDGLSEPIGDLAEAFHLAVWGALGP